jgi:hypothetical protein
MFAERFGSYSISATLPATPCLSRLKSIRRYCRLRAAAAAARRDVAVVVAPARLAERLEQRLLRLVRVISSFE